MPQSPLLTFRSSAFEAIPGEDEETNPGIFGKALAQWLAGQLGARGFTTGQVFAEDFGWCVPIESLAQPVYVACSSGESSDAWQVFTFAEPGLLTRLLGRDESQRSLTGVFDALKDCLTATVDVRELREES
jgi:hypothetical protein